VYRKPKPLKASLLLRAVGLNQVVVQMQLSIFPFVLMVLKLLGLGQKFMIQMLGAVSI
tara:strand:+ start:143 stop:316 length:174 start_codon:yes stop_codon:yes gene_type:complete